MAEMLLQSHAGEIHLLPALPKAWSEGAFRGLRARGGVEVDLTWSAGRATRATLRTQVAGPVRLRLPAGQKLAAIRSAGRKVAFRLAEGVSSFEAAPGGVYELLY